MWETVRAVRGAVADTAVQEVWATGQVQGYRRGCVGLLSDMQGEEVMTVVVNIRKCNPPWGQPGDVRIDRKTKWGNPFFLVHDTPLMRDAVINDYEKWVRQRLSDGALDIEELVDADRLGCWCKPKPCHGDVLVKIIKERNSDVRRIFGVGGFE
jgi:hypothetical protein